MLASTASTAPTRAALDGPVLAACSSREGSFISRRKPCPPSRSRWKNAATRLTGMRNTAATSTIVLRLALSSRNDPSRRSLNIIGCSGRGPVRADPALGNGGYGDPTPHPGPPGPGHGAPGPHAGAGPQAGAGAPPGPGSPGGSQGGGVLVTGFLSSALARIVPRATGPVNGVRDDCGKG